MAILRSTVLYYPLFLLLLFITNSCGQSAEVQSNAAEINTSKRIISLNGSLTELLFSMNMGDQIVGVDITSTYPAKQLKEVPKLGHISQLNTEAILKLTPDLILIDAEQSEKPSIKKLAEAGIKIAPIQLEPTLDNGISAAKQLQAHLPITDAQIEPLRVAIQADMEQLDIKLARLSAHKPTNVLFIYARGTGRILVAGSETDAAKMISLCGGENAIEEFDNFEALTSEALIAASPEVILMFESGLKSLDGLAGLSQIPGINQTPAYKNNRVIAMDGHYLLGFGPRAAKAANELAQKLLDHKTETR